MGRCFHYRCHAVQSLYGLVYATGGSDDCRDFDSAECYNPDTNQWKAVKSMNHKRRIHSLVVADGLLFATGGHHGGANCRHSSFWRCSVEYYNPSDDTWTNIRTVERQYCRFASLGGSLYAVGGCYKHRPLNTVEQYDMKNDKWLPCSPMNAGRYSAAVLVCGGCLYVCGINIRDHQLISLPDIENTIEMYNPSTQCWKDVTSMCKYMVAETVFFQRFQPVVL